MVDQILQTAQLDGVEVTWGSDNVFADLARPKPVEHALKSDLASELRRAIAARGLTQTEAARVLELPQPHLSRLLRGHFENFSVERLMKLLVAIGLDVAIVVRERGDAGAPPAIHVQAG